MAQAQDGPIAETTLSVEPRVAPEVTVFAFGRAACIGALGGLGVGFLLGLVNRLVMRIVAVMNGPTSFETDFGAKVLAFTVEGTLALLVLTTLFAIVPGLLYVGLRRLLPGGVLVRGLVFGLILAATFGTMIVEADTRDFRFLGEPLVSAAMFLGMFVLFGLLIAPVVGWLDRALPRGGSDGLLTLLAMIGALITLVAAPVLFNGHWSWLLVVPLAYAAAVSFGERTGARWTDDLRLVRIGGFLALSVPFARGLIDLGQELTLIAQA